MITFHGKQEIKDKYVARVQAHYDADEIIHGKYWENGKGCAVGCTIHSRNHSKYEKELGIPKWGAFLEDKIFEGMENKISKEFPLRFIKSIPVGVNFDLIKIPFLVFIVQLPFDKFNHERFPYVKKSIDEILSNLKLISNPHLINFEIKNKLLLASKNARKAAHDSACAYYDASASFAAEAFAATSFAYFSSLVAGFATDHEHFSYLSSFADDFSEVYANCSANDAAKKNAYFIFGEKLIELVSDLKPNQQFTAITSE
jgi:hypothetical protein